MQKFQFPFLKRSVQNKVSELRCKYILENEYFIVFGLQA